MSSGRSRGVSPWGSSQASPPPAQGLPPHGPGLLSTSPSPSSWCRGCGLPGAHCSGRGSLSSWLGWLLLSAQRVAWQLGEELKPACLSLDQGKGGSRLQTWVAPRGPLETHSGQTRGGLGRPW